MPFKLLTLCASLAAASTAIAEAPQPQPALPGSAVAAAKAQGRAHAALVASPLIMETQAYVNAQGGISFVCGQLPNPHPVAITINKRSAERQP